MFSFTKPAEYDIIIGPSSTVTGDLESKGSIRIDGKIIGSVTTKGDVIVTENARVEGGIQAFSTHIYGTVQGNVDVENDLTIHSSASLTGDIAAATLSTASGATFNGGCNIKPNKNTPTPKSIQRPIQMANKTNSSTTKNNQTNNGKNNASSTNNNNTSKNSPNNQSNNMSNNPNINHPNQTSNNQKTNKKN